MEYLIGAAFGAAIALIGAFVGGLSAGTGDSPSENSPAKEGEALPDGRGEALLRQWSNLLSYCGKEQHDED